MSSCDRDELFEREQYKQVIALLSDDDGFFVEEHDLAAVPASQGYISAICGGSLPTDRDVNVSVIEDESLLLAYNIANFNTRTEKYARLLPYDKYDIASYNITIPAGERVGLLDIKVRPTGLSPDSVYFLPLRMNRFSTYEANPEKSTLMYRVYMKNFYATNRSDVYYAQRYTLDGSFRVSTKLVRPVGGNSVRIMAGDIPLSNEAESTDEADTTAIKTDSTDYSRDDVKEIEYNTDKGAIVLTVDENNNVKIQSWKDLEVTQVDGNPDYPNKFLIAGDGYITYKTFLLNYTYVYEGETHTV